MDPKTFAKLDPKIRETYERVMGTAIPQKPTTIPAGQPPTLPATAPAAQPVPAATPAPVTPLAHPAETGVTNPVIKDTLTTAPTATPTHTAVHSTIAVHTATHAPEKVSTELHTEEVAGVPGWKKMLFIVLGIIFFGAYAIFWMLFFKVPLPF